MESPADKTDGSSIKPVSSLLARFESMNQASPQPNSTIPRSPAPKPERLRSFKTTGDAAAAPVTPTKNSIPKEKPPIKPKPLHGTALSAQQKRPALDESVLPPPVTVQPPQSPPQQSRQQPIRGDQSPFLDPSTAISHPVISSKPSSAASSRPLTPTHGVPPPRSPRLAGSKPPSPPPPRRTGESRRDKEARSLTPVTTGRSEKRASTYLPPAAFPQRQESLPGSISTKDPSPFTSPPSSNSGSDDESPPQLPTRPNRAANNAVARQSHAAASFQPPSVHHSLADNRGNHTNGIGDSHRALHNDPCANEPPPLPVRRPTQEMPSKTVITHDMAPPPRPVRAPAQQSPPKRDPMPAVHSQPLSTQQFLPPPTRNRSKTLESKNSDKGDFLTSVSPEPKGPAEESALPNIACINRKAPYLKESCLSIEAGYEPKQFDVCGDVVCATGSFTRGWNTFDGGKLFSLIHREGVKATAIIFKPNLDPDDEGDQIWIGMNSGDMMEVDVATGRILCTKPGAHGRYEIKKAYRYRNQIWTLDESGCLHIWGPDVDGTPNLNKNPTHTHRVPTGHTFSLVADGQLWHVASKAIRVFDPWSAAFQVLMKPLITEGTADITAGTTMDAHPRKVFFGHVDGKVSIYSTSDYTCQKVIHIGGWRINTLAAVSADLWVGYSTGAVCIYDTKKSPWVTKKEWQAHKDGIHQLKADAAAPYRIERAQVVSVGNDGMVKLWDGFLQEDKLEASLESNQTKFCQFDELSLMVMTWNAGASTPHSLRYSNGDSSFFQEFVQTSGSPDILVFGFQELVDLEDKTATAKRFLKSKKKDSSDTDNMSHQYRNWQEFLRTTLDDYAPQKPLYQVLSAECLVGLFTCIFVKSSLLGRIKMQDLQSNTVKRGMGGLHGNKGAIAVRFHIDDSSLCFVNCHLAAGQTATNSRHEDIASILKAGLFRKQVDESKRQNYYGGGGDGDLIVDHEICVINGDLNYRIDTMSYETVVRAVKQNKLSRLLDRDQLLVARRRNPAFQLRAFEELPLNFAPTYKYDVGTDRYDSSEKRRSPAWCDRLLYRGNGKIEQLDYGRHEVRVSDHRPVSGNFRLHVKKVDDGKREQVKMEAHKTLEAMRQSYLDEAKLKYLVVTCGLSESESRDHIQDRFARNSR
ncbi:hypothetical protein MY1884_001923 [Beauveria asiatica]